MGDELNRLKDELDQIKHELSEIKRGGTDEGWMALKQAATRIGLSTDALAQRFRRGIYRRVWFGVKKATLTIPSAGISYTWHPSEST